MIEGQDLIIAITKLQVVNEMILKELQDLKPRVTWLETKANYALGIVAGLAVFSSYILQKLGLGK